MRPVFQTIFNAGDDNELPGNCLQAVVASLLELPLDEVPHFVSHGDKWSTMHDEFYLQHGWKHQKTIFNTYRPGFCGNNEMRAINEMPGFDGLFQASVFSPKYSTPERVLSGETVPTHVVIIDKDWNIVHDPNPAYAGMKLYPYHQVLGYNGIISIEMIKKIE